VSYPICGPFNILNFASLEDIHYRPNLFMDLC
jgi:hypothetical protein